MHSLMWQFRDFKMAICNSSNLNTFNSEHKQSCMYAQLRTSSIDISNFDTELGIKSLIKCLVSLIEYKIDLLYKYDLTLKPFFRTCIQEDSVHERERE